MVCRRQQAFCIAVMTVGYESLKEMQKSEISYYAIMSMVCQ